MTTLYFEGSQGDGGHRSRESSSIPAAICSGRLPSMVLWQRRRFSKWPREAAVTTLVGFPTTLHQGRSHSIHGGPVRNRGRGGTDVDGVIFELAAGASTITIWLFQQRKRRSAGGRRDAGFQRRSVRHDQRRRQFFRRTVFELAAGSSSDQHPGDIPWPKRASPMPGSYSIPTQPVWTTPTGGTTPPEPSSNPRRRHAGYPGRRPFRTRRAN